VAATYAEVAERLIHPREYLVDLREQALRSPPRWR
jgi:hypothetical protein